LQSNPDSAIKYWTKFIEEIQDGGGFWGTGIEILHNIDDREAAQKMKRAAEPVAKNTQYEKSDKEENCEGNHKSNDDHPNAVDLSLFDDDDERVIDDDYYMMEGYTQRSERTHVHLTDLSEIKRNQVISARISNESSLLLPTGEESIQTSAGGNASRTVASNITTCQYSHAKIFDIHW